MSYLLQYLSFPRWSKNLLLLARTISGPPVGRAKRGLLPNPIGFATRPSRLCCDRVIARCRPEGRTTLLVMPRGFVKAADRMRRRDFIALVGGAAAWMVPARAQAMPVIGYLGSETPGRYSSRLSAFREGLAEAGYAEGRTVAIEFRWAEGQYSRLPALATDLANRQVTVIVAAGGAEVALAAKSATATIPIVFEMGGDPIALGVVDSLSRPGGNLTGVSSQSVEVSRKRLEFMREVRPNANVFAVAINPTSPTAELAIEEPPCRCGQPWIEACCPEGQHRAGVRRHVHRCA